jgi:hypothetical protein
MRVEEVRVLLRAQPFVPFTVVLPDGNRTAVTHHDFGVLSADGRKLFVWELGQAVRRCTLVDVMLIASIQIEFAASGPET